MNHQPASAIIENSMAALGLDKDIKTDPQIIQSILREMKLDDFQTAHFAMQKFFAQSILQPQNLQSIFENIKKGIINKHPAIIEFLELALEKKWLAPSEHIIRSVHTTYILEAVTAGMCNSHDFFVEVQDHYKAKEKMCGINFLHTLSTFIHVLGITHNFFGTVKTLSVDPAMTYFRNFKNNDVRSLWKNKKINYLEYKFLSTLQKNGLGQANELMKINIYEAGITEFKQGLKANTVCAYELLEDIKKNPPHAILKKKSVVPENNTDIFYETIMEKENSFPAAAYKQDWVSLYITWNMAFILNCLDDLDLLFPKLLIPSVINSESENFAGARIISLWLSINHVIFRKYDKKVVTGPKNKMEMARAWAEINKKYAFQLAKRETREDSKILMKHYHRFFSHPIYNIFKLMKNL